MFPLLCIEYYDKIDWGRLSKNHNAWDILDNNIDIVIADFSITAERLDIIDFSIPLATEGLTIFMRTPKAMDVTLFSFFLPYTSTVWTSLLAALIIGIKKSGAEYFNLT